MTDSSVIIGLDFGSHTALISIWNQDKAVYEVVADELGSRTIPCAVAFRESEVVVGQAALSQQFKNPSNTFTDIRSMILDPTLESVFVPLLDRSISVSELVSHFFRNLHNQIKQQVGRVVRECILSIPFVGSVNEVVRQRLMESAQAGGIRVKAIVPDALATILAFGLDVESSNHGAVAVIDVGWSQTAVSFYSVKKGLIFPMLKTDNSHCCLESKEMSGSVLVRCLSEFCVKDFQRRTKANCSDSNRSIMRLRAQCEEAVKHLSTGQEAMIDIDSLYEGIDYSAKITRARFEDIASIPLMHLRALLNSSLAALGLEGPQVGVVCLVGGPAAMPRLISSVKSVFPAADFPRVRFESSESVCVGAALHGSCLLDKDLVDKAPTACPSVKCLSLPLFVHSSPESEPAVPASETRTMILDKGSPLPGYALIVAECRSSSAFFQLIAGSIPLANVVVSPSEDCCKLDIAVTVEVTGDIQLTVSEHDVSSGGQQNVLVSLVIPAPQL